MSEVKTPVAPLSFTYNPPAARLYGAIGSPDDANAAPIVRQYGIESRLAWARSCEEVSVETTGEDPKAAQFFAAMQSHQA